MLRRILLAILMVATFVTSTSAVVSWQQPPGVGVTCLRRVYGARWPAGICRHNLAAGPQSITLPGPLSDPAYRPSWGDVYILEFEGVDVGQATLGESFVYTTYLAVVRKDAPDLVERVRLPWVGR